jgi:tetratricopeptide (TPR) repeat protein
MNFAKNSSLLLAVALVSLTAVPQTREKTQKQEQAPSAQPAPAQQQSAAKPAPEANKEAKKADHAASYYHFAMAHMYEEMMAMYGRAEYANKAIEEYRLAIAADPASEYLNSALAELYSRTGRIRDAVLEAQEIIQRDPNNLEAHRLLGHIYLRSLGDPQGGGQSQEVLKLAIEQYEALVRIEPKNADNYLLLGRLYLLNKDLLKAETQFKQALKLDPSSEEAVTNLAFLFNDEGDTKRALETLNSVPEAARTSKIYAALGATYEKQKDYKSAVDAYQRALKLDKENIDAMRGLAQNLANDNQVDAALTEYKAVQDADPQDPQAAVEMSKLYRRMGKLDLAMESLKKAEPLSQEMLEVPYNEALILEAQGKFDEAAAALQKLVSRTTSPDGNYSAGERNNRAVFLQRLGNIYRESGHPQQAVETFRKMIDLGGDEAARGYQELIDTYREQKQWPEASRAAQEAAGKFPDNRSLKLALALQLADDGKSEEAIKLAKSAIKGVPAEDMETYMSLCQLYSRLKRWKEAEDALNEASRLASHPDEKEYLQYLQGSLYERQKKYDQAEQAFRQVLQQNPSNGTTLNYLGYMLADRNTHLEEALTLIKKALSLEPQNPAYIDSLGWVYFKLGNFDLAEENLRQAAERTPNDATIQDHLAELYARTGRLKLAVSHWERALNEWNKSLAADVDQDDVTRVQKKLETTKVKLAQQQR